MHVLFVVLTASIICSLIFSIFFQGLVFGSKELKNTLSNQSSPAISVNKKQNPITLTIHPFPIEITIPYGVNMPSYGLEISSNQNVENIKIHFSNFKSDDPNKLWISRNLISSNPPTINVAAGDITDINVLFNITNITGSYRGTMTLLYPGGVIKYPVHLEMVGGFPSYLMGILVLAGGMVTSYFVRLIRLQNDARQESLIALSECRIEMATANMEKRRDQNFDSGVKNFFEGIKMMENGFFAYSKKTFEAATQLFKTSKEETKNSKEAEILKQNTEIPPSDKIISIAHTISGTGLINSMKQDSILLYAVTMILLLMAAIQVWSTVFPKVLPLVGSAFWYLSTFLLGYGSQAALSEVIEFARRR